MNSEISCGYKYNGLCWMYLHLSQGSVRIVFIADFGFVRRDSIHAKDIVKINTYSVDETTLWILISKTF